MFEKTQRWASRLAVVGLALGSVHVAAAQNEPTIRLQPEDVDRGSHGPQQNFFFLPPNVTGENYVDAGFFGQRLRPYLAGNQEALNHLNAYRSRKTWFLVDRVILLGSVGLYGQQVYAGRGDAEYFNNTQKVAAGIFVASLLSTIFINKDTNFHFQRAVASYNAGKDDAGLWPRLRPSSVGLGCAPTGQPLLALRWAVR